MQNTHAVKGRGDGEVQKKTNGQSKTNDGYSNAYRSNQWQRNGKPQQGYFKSGSISHGTGNESARVNFVYDLEKLNNLVEYQNNFCCTSVTKRGGTCSLSA